MKERSWLAVAAGVVTIAAWAMTVRSAGTMSLSMPMPGGWSMSMAWMAMGDQSRVGHAAMFLTMWAVMMIAMMLPSVMPTVLLHRKLVSSRVERGEAARGSQLLLLIGYFAVWVGFGAAAYLAGMLVTRAAMRHESLSRLLPLAIGGTLTSAGVYQLTNWKRSCLAHCRSPLSFFSQYPIRRSADSLALGVHHGVYCAACCWGLMAVQLALGVMSIPLMAVVAAVIFVEKRWKYGQRFAVAVGLAAIIAGISLLLQSPNA